ncbi:MAG: HRDC domain-containing protein, partial [Euzebyaceae bacterium]|nr:HRDC domain-containing protein [Euzebyaceae bacterium]
RKGGRAAAVPAGADPAVAERLRAWRRERSQRDGVPAYVVFPDSTLHELAARRPATPRALRAVPGFGPTRAERYGDETLEVIAAAKDDPDVLT